MWAFTRHVFWAWNENLLLLSPLSLWRWWSCCRGAAPFARRAAGARRCRRIVAVLGVLALLPGARRLADRRICAIVALALPMHLALAWALSLPLPTPARRDDARERARPSASTSAARSPTSSRRRRRARSRRARCSSTPADQSEAVADGARARSAAPDVERFVHGTTVATNMLLERKGARVVLVRHARASPMCCSSRGRTARRSTISRAHHPRAARAARAHDRRSRSASRPRASSRRSTTTPMARRGRARRARSTPDVVAVCAAALRTPTPSHERALADGDARARCRTSTSCSRRDVLPEIREYERTATTVAEAYLRPGVARYLARLSDARRGRAACPRPA